MSISQQLHNPQDIFVYMTDSQLWNDYFKKTSILLNEHVLMVFFMGDKKKRLKKSKLGSAIQMHYFGLYCHSSESESAQDQFHYCLLPHFQFTG